MKTNHLNSVDSSMFQVKSFVSGTKFYGKYDKKTTSKKSSAKSKKK